MSNAIHALSEGLKRQEYATALSVGRSKRKSKPPPPKPIEYKNMATGEPCKAPIASFEHLLKRRNEEKQPRRFSKLGEHNGNDGSENVFVDEILNSLLDGDTSRYFKMVDDTLLCTIEGGMEVPVLVDNTLDLDDVSNFCPLLDWRSIEDIVGTDDGVANLAEVPKQSRYTETEMQTALEYAAKSKEFPPNIEKDSDFHIEFLFRHFCRLAKPSRVKKCDKKRWKKAIKDNLDVLSDSIGCMKCGPYEFELVEGAKPVRQRPYPLSPVKKDALSKMIAVLVENDILEQSTTSEWNSPLLLVSKGDGRWRLVVDYRRVNMLIANSPVVYPRPDDLFETVQKAFWMFLIDGRDLLLLSARDRRAPQTNHDLHNSHSGLPMEANAAGIETFFGCRNCAGHQFAAGNSTCMGIVTL